MVGMPHLLDGWTRRQFPDIDAGAQEVAFVAAWLEARFLCAFDGRDSGPMFAAELPGLNYFPPLLAAFQTSGPD